MRGWCIDCGRESIPESSLCFYCGEAHFVAKQPRFQYGQEVCFKERRGTEIVVAKIRWNLTMKMWFYGEAEYDPLELDYWPEDHLTTIG
jgi:hypothetical protein